MAHFDPQDSSSVAAALAGVGYIPDAAIATTLLIALKLGKPLLLEGPAGTGKTALAQAVSEITGRPLVRLQGYEGLDESKALYEWEYAKQLLYTQILRDKIGERLAGAETLHDAMELLADEEAVFFQERFLLPRPLLRALREPGGAVLLVDEVDKTDPEFEAFLLEVLGEYQVTVPELGTLKALVQPIVLLTSNRQRELSEALRRRCLHLWLDFPDAEREAAIVHRHVPGLPARLAVQLVAFVRALREQELVKAPSVAETVDWARALIVLHADTLDADLVASSLGVLLKVEEDRNRTAARLPELLAVAGSAA
jgi:MoxR-like ATPase